MTTKTSYEVIGTDLCRLAHVRLDEDKNPYVWEPFSRQIDVEGEPDCWDHYWVLAEPKDGEFNVVQKVGGDPVSKRKAAQILAAIKDDLVEAYDEICRKYVEAWQYTIDGKVEDGHHMDVCQAQSEAGEYLREHQPMEEVWSTTEDWWQANTDPSIKLLSTPVPGRVIVGRTMVK